MNSFLASSSSSLKKKNHGMTMTTLVKKASPCLYLSQVKYHPIQNQLKNQILKLFSSEFRFSQPYSSHSKLKTEEFWDTIQEAPRPLPKRKQCHDTIYFEKYLKKELKIDTFPLSTSTSLHRLYNHELQLSPSMAYTKPKLLDSVLEEIADFPHVQNTHRSSKDRHRNRNRNQLSSNLHPFSSPSSLLSATFPNKPQLNSQVASTLSSVVLKKIPSSSNEPSLKKGTSSSLSIEKLAKKWNMSVNLMQEHVSLFLMNDHLVPSDFVLAKHQEQAFTTFLKSMLSSSSSPSRSSEDPLIDLRPTSSSSSLSSSWPSRAPIVTIMGHVDHGKTTLLDTLRGTSIATTEAGGITQHLGAFEVVLSNQSKITFLDTPGHAAFENLRERGAQVTDIVVLVVAVDDGVMPQTIEAIKHAQAAQVPIIVALNKCDRKGAEDVEKTKLALLRHGVQVEDLGGDVMSIPISALKGTGIDHLEEAIVTLSELQELRGDVEGAIEAVILESQVRKGVGPVATVLLRHGTLRQGTILVTSDTWCRVRRMVNAFGQTVLSVGPSTPVEVHGWKALPISGQPVYSTSNEAKAKKYVLQQATTPTPPSPSPLSSNILHGALKELNQSASTKKCITIGVKGDVSGSVEALVHFVHSFSHPELQLQLLFSGVGPFSESELTLAQSSQAILVGLNLKLDKTSILWIQKNKLMYIGSNVIYTLFNDLKLHLASYLDPLYSIEKIGSAQILQFFPYQTEHEVVTVLGCKVLDGKIMKNKNVQILRKEELVWEGPLKTIRHFKKEVHEISKGNECGIVIDGFDQCQINDTLHCIQKVSIPRTID